MTDNYLLLKAGSDKITGNFDILSDFTYNPVLLAHKVIALYSSKTVVS